MNTSDIRTPKPVSSTRISLRNSTSQISFIYVHLSRHLFGTLLTPPCLLLRVTMMTMILMLDTTRLPGTCSRLSTRSISFKTLAPLHFPWTIWFYGVYRHGMASRCLNRIFTNGIFITWVAQIPPASVCSFCYFTCFNINGQLLEISDGGPSL